MQKTDPRIYDPAAVEGKWRQHWRQNDGYRVPAESHRPAYYVCDMFPYPSGDGLTVGHWRGYVLSDVIARQKRMQGFDVLHPMGWDAFGLPAENHAIKTGTHPAVQVAKNTAHFQAQLEAMGPSYDWSRAVNTTDPAYYRWTQWIFLQMYKAGLAYRTRMPINWCPTCQVGLANEEAQGGACERCGSSVTKKELEQWMLRITAYAEPLLAGLTGLDWPAKVKKMQSDWIGKSTGADVDFPVSGAPTGAITVFTTRPDTSAGVSFLVLAPEHPAVGAITTEEQRAAVQAYQAATAAKSNIDRMSGSEKTGVFTGASARHPLTGAAVPVWLADYVLPDYGTGAVMGVPAGDERDADFAATHGLPVIGYPPQTIDAAVATLAAAGAGRPVIRYKMRDWLFSRQRYWGEPIPIVHCAHCGEVPVPEDQLPVRLPAVERYAPTGTGESPLAAMASWVSTPCPQCDAPARRETNTMPQWAGSCWYFLRYTDPHNTAQAWDPKQAERFLPMDLYVGGVEHAVLHLLYARFFMHFLHEQGLVPTPEPFTRLFNQGMICKDGAKISKSKGNAVYPDPLVARYGTDALRLYILFLGPPEQDVEWDDRGIVGTSRFLQRVWSLVAQAKAGGAPRAAGAADQGASAGHWVRFRHRLVAQVTERLDGLRMNTAVSVLMEGLSALEAAGPAERALPAWWEALRAFVLLLQPFAPHMGAELYQALGGKGEPVDAPWPTFDSAQLQAATVTVPVLVDGKLRGRVQIAPDASTDVAHTAAAALPAAQHALVDRTLVRVVYVPGKTINFVTT